MRSVFLGTPAAAVPTLRSLATVSDVQMVLTRPDSSRGRSKRSVPSEIATEADRLGINVVKPQSRTELEEALRSVGPVDVGVVVAFGMILTEAALRQPSAGMVNLHFSVLPRWRGAAPVERAILAGDVVSGVTLMAMDAGLDTGPVIATNRVVILEGESAGELTTRLAAEAAALLKTELSRWVQGDIEPIPQRDGLATYASKLTTPESLLSASMVAGEFIRTVRAFNPRPGAHGYIAGERFKIMTATTGPGPVLEPGHLELAGDGLWVGLADRSVRLITVQPAGKRVMDGDAWARGQRGELGAMA